MPSATKDKTRERRAYRPYQSSKPGPRPADAEDNNNTIRNAVGTAVLADLRAVLATLGPQTHWEQEGMPTHLPTRDERAVVLCRELNRVLRAFADRERDERERGAGIEEINNVHRAHIEEAYRSSGADSEQRADAHAGPSRGSSRRSNETRNPSEPDSGPSVRDFPPRNAACDNQMPHFETDERPTRPQTVFGRYREKWRQLREFNGKGMLCFHQLPWPILHANTIPAAVVQPTDITDGNLFAFYSQHDEPDRDGLRKLIRQELCAWHPDKIQTLIEAKVASCDQEAATEASQCITRFLFQMLKYGGKQG